MELRTLLVLLLIMTPHWSFAAPKKVTTQKTTYVKASPLRVSKAEQMRHQRMMEEAKTEEQMLKELERARLADERRRANQYQYKNTYKPQKAYQPKVVAETDSKYKPVTQSTAPIIADDNDDELMLYFSLMGGFVDQFESSNVNGNGAGGINVGLQFQNGFALEASAIFANHISSHAYCGPNNNSCGPNQFDQVLENNVDQYYGSLGLKYFIDLGYRLRPSIGAVMAYNYRQHIGLSGNRSRNSEAIDGGGSVGADIVLSKYVHLGFDWRFMANLSYQLDGQSQDTNLREVSTQDGSSLVDFESTSYQMWLLSVKFLF